MTTYKNYLNVLTIKSLLPDGRELSSEVVLGSYRCLFSAIAAANRAVDEGLQGWRVSVRTSGGVEVAHIGISTKNIYEQK